tara:strand:- start:77 stop:472 length:396 start_codon:yes stop_codon:yes gene_type:complete
MINTNTEIRILNLYFNYDAEDNPDHIKKIDYKIRVKGERCTFSKEGSVNVDITDFVWKDITKEDCRSWVKDGLGDEFKTIEDALKDKVAKRISGTTEGSGIPWWNPTPKPAHVLKADEVAFRKTEQEKMKN